MESNPVRTKTRTKQNTCVEWQDRRTLLSGGHQPSYKVVIVGDEGVGKTSLLWKFVHNEFKEDGMHTLRVDIERVTVTVRCRDGDKPYQLQLWDTVGQERFRSTLSTSYYKGAHAVILVYSTTDRESFRNVQEFWLNQVHIQYGNDATDKLPVLLVGTKSDLLKKYDEQQEHVKKVDSRCMKGTTDRLLGPIHCSAKTGRNVDRVFQKIADELAVRDSTGYVPQPINITKVSSKCFCSS